MKILLSLAIGVCAVLLFASCDKNETNNEQWKLDNEAQFAKITADTKYTRINSESGKGHIMYRVIESGDGKKPYFTDKVKLLYTGWFKYDWSKPDTYEDGKGGTVTNKIIFESTFRDDIPVTLEVRGLIDGFRTALQHMRVGDKWEVWIPWQLAYEAPGRSSSGTITIPPYTMLVFEIKLVGIEE